MLTKFQTSKQEKRELQMNLYDTITRSLNDGKYLGTKYDTKDPNKFWRIYNQAIKMKKEDPKYVQLGFENTNGRIL